MSLNQPILRGLRHLRLTKQWTQQELGRRLGISAKTVFRYENRRMLPRVSLLEKLCVVLDCRMWQLFHEPEEEAV